MYAIEAGSIAAIDVARPEQATTLRWPEMDDPPKLLLGRGRDDPQAIAVLTSKGRVLSFSPSDGRTAGLAPSLSAADIATLTRHLGACGRSVVYEGEQKGRALATRTDVFIRDLNSRIGTAVTGTWPGVVHGQPAFSDDCRRIVFVSDER